MLLPNIMECHFIEPELHQKWLSHVANVAAQKFGKLHLNYTENGFHMHLLKK